MSCLKYIRTIKEVSFREELFMPLAKNALEMCGLISEKWDRLPQGTFSDEPLLETMVCLVPSLETEAF